MEMTHIKFGVREELNISNDENLRDRLSLLDRISDETFKNAFTFGLHRNRFSLQNILDKFLKGIFGVQNQL